MMRQRRVLGLWLALLVLCAPHLFRIQPIAAIPGMVICRAGSGSTPAPVHHDQDCPPCVLCAAATADLALVAGPSILPLPRFSWAADAGWQAASGAAPAVAPIPAARGPPLA